jgi:hypothetical protein
VDLYDCSDVNLLLRQPYALPQRGLPGPNRLPEAGLTRNRVSTNEQRDQDDDGDGYAEHQE